MKGNTETKSSRTKFIIALVACIIIAVVFLISGTGKLAPSKEGWALPGQTIDFISRLLPNDWIMSDAFMFVYNFVIPVLVPYVELAIAIFLIIGFMPRLMAAITILLTLVFIADNSYAIYIGTGQFASCACFGVWEKIFGGLTPVQSLVIDIILLGLAVVIIVLHPGGFFQSREWLRNLGKKKKIAEKPVSK